MSLCIFDVNKQYGYHMANISHIAIMLNGHLDPIFCQCVPKHNHLWHLTQMLLPCITINEYASQMPHLSHTCKLLHTHIQDNYVSIDTSYELTAHQQCDQDHWYIYISHYWHLPLKKYACDIVHMGTTALLLYSTYRPYIQVKTNCNSSTMLLPFICQQKICTSNTTYIQHTKITSCVDLRQTC